MRVRRARGLPILIRNNRGSRHLLGAEHNAELANKALINEYKSSENNFNNLMHPNYYSLNGLKRNNSSRFLRTLRTPFNRYKNAQAMNLLTRPVARRSRRRGNRRG